MILAIGVGVTGPPPCHTLINVSVSVAFRVINYSVTMLKSADTGHRINNKMRHNHQVFYQGQKLWLNQK